MTDQTAKTCRISKPLQVRGISIIARPEWNCVRNQPRLIGAAPSRATAVRAF